MQRFYIVPIETVISGDSSYRGPKYFQWRMNQNGIVCLWCMMDYGSMPSALLLATDISDTDDANLVLNTDVFGFPISDLDVAIPSNNNIKTFTAFDPA